MSPAYFGQKMIQAGGQKQDKQIAKFNQGLGENRVFCLEQNRPSGLPEECRDTKRKEAGANSVNALSKQRKKTVGQE